MHSEHHRIFAAKFWNTMLRINYSKTELDLRFLVFFYISFLVLYVCFLCFLFILWIVSPFVYRLLFPIFVQVYRPSPPGGNPLAVNKYHITSYINYTSYIILYLISYRIITYNITSYHFIPYHIIYHMGSMDPGTLRSEN